MSLYDEIRIPVVYGTVVGTELEADSVSIFTADGNPAPFEPQVVTRSPFRTELVIERALLSYTGTYMIRVFGGSSVAMAIRVNRK